MKTLMRFLSASILTVVMLLGAIQIFLPANAGANEICSYTGCNDPRLVPDLCNLPGGDPDCHQSAVYYWNTHCGPNSPC